jgi:SPX domain protein involved in polyphosphate accumulation
LDIIERYEFKYLVPERLVRSLRATALTTCRQDRYAGADGTYRIRSLYFDNSRFDLFWANDREQKARFKARVRTYPGKDSPTYLEIKRRCLDVIIKTRAALPADRWQEALNGGAALLDELPARTRKSTESFLDALHRHHLRPTLIVDYEREAYESVVDTYARLTFDRKIICQSKDTVDLATSGNRWRPIDHPAQTWTQEPVCVLELKFERRPPPWMVALVRHHDLVRRSFSKYCYGVVAQLSLPTVRAARCLRRAHD